MPPNPRCQYRPGSLPSVWLRILPPAAMAAITGDGLFRTSAPRPMQKAPHGACGTLPKYGTQGTGALIIGGAADLIPVYQGERHGHENRRAARTDHRRLARHRRRTGASLRGRGLPPRADRPLGGQAAGAGAGSARPPRRAGGRAAAGHDATRRGRPGRRLRRRYRRAGQQRRRHSRRQSLGRGRAGLAPGLGAESLRLHRSGAGGLSAHEAPVAMASSSTTSATAARTPTSTISPARPAMRR
ncbi:Uncharacterised protein [Bordetella parapertussis]|nr:Uncharacterised protein [Bordetella parapertussis]SUV60490.1 Uncharacterised protein [Bordetella parapertussis]SUV81677.1 Uncharacterised protein [Bordetella parapertussis]VEF51664.1 Uncharacterised protein [Bordetella parapertussis]VTR44062.1 Uncharacterised protein [Bordetella parapertussis]